MIFYVLFSSSMLSATGKAYNMLRQIKMSSATVVLLKLTEIFGSWF